MYSGLARVDYAKLVRLTQILRHGVAAQIPLINSFTTNSCGKEPWSMPRSPLLAGVRWLAAEVHNYLSRSLNLIKPIEVQYYRFYSIAGSFTWRHKVREMYSINCMRRYFNDIVALARAVKTGADRCG